MKFPRFAIPLLVAVLAGAYAAGIRAETPPAPTIAPAGDRVEHALAERARVRDIPAVALSHDGRRLAWIVAHGDDAQLQLAGADGRDPRTIAMPGACPASEIRWAARSDVLAVLTRCKPEPSNTHPIHSAIWLLDVAAGSPLRKLSDLDGFAQGIQWVSGDQRIAFLLVPGATRAPAATASGNPRVGEIGVRDVQVQHIASIVIDGGTVETLTPANLYVYEFRWSPVGNRIAFTAAPPPGDNNWWTAQLYVQNARADASPKPLVDPSAVQGSLHGLQLALPRWSPNAARILFIGGLMSDRGATGGDIYAVPASGGAPVNLTRGTRVSPSWFTFVGPHSLLVSQIASGSVQVAGYTLSGNTARQTRLWFTAPGMIGDGRAALSISVSDGPTRRIAYAADSFDQAPEVHAGVLATMPPPSVTSINSGLTRSWGKVRSIEWHHDGMRVQGWLLYPANYDPHKSWPMVVYVHGGPSWANLPGWGGNPTMLSEFGYFVLMPNPRGSLGGGERYAQAIRNQMGYGDLDDILAGVDQAEKIAPIDDRRLGMMGWSYGGFMSMFAPTRTHRFRAVVAGAGISDWQSYYGENQIDQWMIPFFGASLYDDPAAYAKSSAINFIKQTRTPALIVVGERDEECPAPQSFEYWHALKTLGVPTTLVVYANEGHHFAQHKNQIDVVRRTLSWFDRYLAKAPAE